MAAVTMTRSRHVGPLTDVTTSLANLPQSQPFTQSITRVDPRDKYNPSREKHIQRVLISPYRTHLLALKGYYLDESNVVRKDPNIKMAPIATEQKVPSTKANLTSATTTVAPYAQSTADTVSGVSLVRASPTGPQPQVADQIAHITSLSPMPTGSASQTSSQFDKALPLKPVLRRAESPERRGIYDAYDSGSEKVHCQPLQPSITVRASSSFAASGDISFEVSPSLHSDLYNSPEVALETTVNARKVSATAVAVCTKKSSPLSKDQPSRSLKAMQLPRSSLPRAAQRRVLPATGQISALRNGSPVSRHTPKSKFNRTKFDSSPNGVQRSKIEIKREVKAIDKVSDADSADLSGLGSPHELDDLTRRSIKFGIGATIRSSKDAHRVIMGDSAGISNNSTRPSTKSATAGDSLKTLVPKVTANRETPIHRTDCTFPARVSSLPGSPNEVVTKPKPSVVSRLARPTKASAARTAANSDSMTSVKKFGSRLSSILPGRRRSDLQGSVDKVNKFTSIEKNTASARFESVEGGSTLKSGYAHSIRGRALLTTYENSGMELMCSELVGADVDGSLMGQPTDKVAPQQSQQDERDRQAADFYASETHITTNICHAHRAAIPQRGGHRGGDDEPLTPITRTGLLRHYSEEEQEDEQVQLQMLRNIVANSIPPSAHNHFDQLLMQTQRALRVLTITTERIENRRMRSHMIDVNQSVGESVLAARTAAAAIVALSDANERLLTTTVILAQYAGQVAGVVEMNDN